MLRCVEINIVLAGNAQLQGRRIRVRNGYFGIPGKLLARKLCAFCKRVRGGHEYHGVKFAYYFKAEILFNKHGFIALLLRAAAAQYAKVIAGIGNVGYGAVWRGFGEYHFRANLRVKRFAEAAEGGFYISRARCGKRKLRYLFNPAFIHCFHCIHLRKYLACVAQKLLALRGGEYALGRAAEYGYAKPAFKLLYGAA